ncbi:MAG: valine--tRNA ligase [Phycisphaerae bacterium]
MAQQELAKTYEPTQVESEIYRLWEQSGAFKAVPDDRPPEKRFVVMIPLPNVTGALHLGHAINNTLQDIQTRYHRMAGYNSLWQPGTDHAGIATQAVVERRILETEGKSRHDLGRDELVRRIWEWKDQYEKRILGQLKEMGCSCDWERTRFTLDEVCAKAVRHTFFKLFKDGLIFRGKRLVNWDTYLQTAVADDEVFHETVKGNFWHFKYPIIDPQPGEPEHVIIATTRPETLLGDTAVAVNPDPEAELNRREEKLRVELESASGKTKAEIQSRIDRLAERRETHLQRLIKLRDMAKDGRKVMLPLVDRPIPLVCDPHADPELGSGCVKITPAHDPNDYEVAQRAGLPMINVLTPDGKVAKIIEPDGSVNAHNERYEGLTFAVEGRRRVVEDLEAAGLLHEVEERSIDLGHSDRSKTPIEPFLSDQWFVKMGDIDGGITLADGSKSPGLAQSAMDAVKSDKVQIFPDRYRKTYLDWLGEKRDWCISRQLWWGHRIPVWTVSPNAAGETQQRAREQMIGFLRAAQVEDDVHCISSPDNYRFMICAGSERAHQALAAFKIFHDELPAKEVDGKTLPVAMSKIPGFEDATNAACDVHDVYSIDQDPDVLDTWFSSQLWPFSTLGWPDPETSEKYNLDYYYPGKVLITSRDIITLWVARMVLSGLYLIGEVPFRHVYIHTKILDGRGETMSKSKGNGVDPVNIIHQYGADALRYTIADMATETQDVRMPVEYLCPHCQHLTPQTSVVPKNKRPLDVKKVKCKSCNKPFATQWADDALKEELGVALDTSDKFELGRNFANKLWNAARFAFMNLEGAPHDIIKQEDLAAEDRWILAKLSATIRRTHQQILTYQFSQCIKDLREFFWDALCDWYIELTKARITPPSEPGAQARGTASGSGPDAARAQQILALVIDQTLRLFHPIMPFITEQLWQQLNAIVPQRGLPGLAEPLMGELLIQAQFPPEQGWPKLDDEEVLEVFEDLQAATRGIRDLRAKCNVPPREKVAVTLIAPADRIEALRADASILQRMANVDPLTVTASATRPKNAATAIVGQVQIFVHDISDDQAEAARLEKEIQATQKQIAASKNRLANEKFTQNAAPEVVQAARDRLEELEAKLLTLKDHQALLG